MNENYLFTSESVTEGHPDKVCDLVSDSILDSILEQDSNARVACETLVTKGEVIISGEITTSANIDYKKIAFNTLELIGYKSTDLDYNGNEYKIRTIIKQQSPHIAQGVNQYENHEQGAGDQGLMFGYACKETPELMPLPIIIAHCLTKKLSEVRKNGTLPWLKPDGKSQVTIEYDKNNNPLKVKKIVIATQHEDMLSKFNDEADEHLFISNSIIENVIMPVLELYNLQYDKEFIINGTGRFVEGGPIADVGLTGRKIIVDTYGGYSRHGGGAFSGKDPSKVDRSAAYMARYIAKNIVAAELADRCEVQLAYCIGIPDPMSVNIETFNTSKVENSKLISIIKEVFDLKPASIVDKLNLKSPIYSKYAAYGHFGREIDCSWEKSDMIEKLREKII
jgi:S-adenosylmethionine synthetase